MAHNAAQICAQLGQKYPSLPNLKLEIKGASSANGPNLPPWIASLEFLGQKITIHEIKEKKTVVKRILCDLVLGNVFEEHREKLDSATIPYVQLHYVSKSEYTEVPEGVVLPSYGELIGIKVGKKSKGLASRDCLGADAMLRNAVRFVGLKIVWDVVCENIGLVEKLMIDGNVEKGENGENAENGEKSEKTEKSDEVFAVAIKDDPEAPNSGETAADTDEPVSKKPKFPTTKRVRMTIVLTVLTISESNTQTFFTAKHVSESVENEKLPIALAKKEIKEQLSEKALEKLLELEKIPAKDVILWKKEQKCSENIKKRAELNEFNRVKTQEKIRQKEENKFQQSMKVIEARDRKLQKRIDMEGERTKRYQQKQESYMEVQRGKQMWRGSNNRNVGSVREQFRSAGDISNEYIQGHSQNSGFNAGGFNGGVKRDIYGNRCSNPLMVDRRRNFNVGESHSNMTHNVGGNHSNMTQLARAWQTGYNQSNYDQNYKPNQLDGSLPIRKSDSQNNLQHNYSNQNKPDPRSFGW